MITDAEAHLRRGSEFLAVLERQNLRHPDLLTSAQQAVECLAEAIYSLLGLEFSMQHETLLALSKEEETALLQRELQKIRETEPPMLYPYADLLPRVVFLVFSWSAFRRQAEAGAQALSRPLSLFFSKDEARTALEQARLCHKAAKSLLELKR